MKKLLAVVAAVGLLGGASAANASIIISSFNTTAVNGFPTGSFGTVTLSDQAGGVVVDVTLATGFSFISTGNHSSFAFNLDKSIAASQIQNISPSGKYAVSLINEPGTPYGDFSVALNVSAGNGGSKAVPPPLDFTVTGVTTADFNLNPNGYLFVADVIYGGNTGSIAAKTFTTGPSSPPTSVPEPGSLAILGAGLVLAGVVLRHRSGMPQ